MKILLTIVFSLLVINSYSQYSNYYNVYKTVDINQKVSISGNINTIDYGSLALANAQRERNRLESQRYADDKEREISLLIAKDPTLAFDYGHQTNNKTKNLGGFKRYTDHLIIPHKSLFTFAGGGRLENISSDGITTEIICFQTEHLKDAANTDYESFVKEKLDEIKIGEINIIENQKCFVHKKDLGRANVYSNKGFVTNYVWEDDYQYTITDRYSSLSEDGNLFMFRVSYYGNKKEVTFEKLEGRRFYLKRLIDKVVSASSISDYKF
jgi:hypothetical protein